MTESRRIEFDGWTLQVETGELRRHGENGHNARLQEQPLQVLIELLTRPGELLTREQLIARLWPKGVVDFDAGLNTVVRKLRIALQDDSDSPRYIETVPRKGYRYIGPPPRSAPNNTTGTQRSDVITDTSNSPLTPSSAPSLETPPPNSIWQQPHVYIYAAIAVVVISIVANIRKQPEPLAHESAIAAQTSIETIAVLPFRTPSADERSRSIAEGFAAVVRDGLSNVQGLAVLSASSIALARGNNAVELGKQLRARYVVQGDMQQRCDDFEFDIKLIDVQSNHQRWTEHFSDPVADTAAARNHIVEGIAATFQLEAATHDRNRHAELQAYEILTRAERLLATQRFEAATDAAQLCARATELDPQFARAYACIGEALILRLDVTPAKQITDVTMRADQTLKRALEINPNLGEAWIHRARITTDRALAEQFYRQGLQLAPAYGAGYAYFAGLLIDRQRRGEASEIVDRGQQHDPLSTLLRQLKASMFIFSRNDVAGYDAQLREALTIDPTQPQVMGGLAYSQYIWSGEVANALGYAEQMYTLQPELDNALQFVVAMQLDLGNADAAAAALRGAPTSAAHVELLQYRRDMRRAALLARDAPIMPRDSVSPIADAIRDGALLSGEFDTALKRLESTYSGWSKAPISNRSTAIVYAHTLMLSGEKERGRELAESILALLDAEGAGRPQGWFARERAAALAALGETDKALDELALSAKLKRLQRWWYTTDLDPLYDEVRKHARFAAIKKEGMDHLAKQRALHDAQSARATD